jgi:hypothetical protein
MNIEQLKFMARLIADLDWQKVGANENPYSLTYQQEAYQAYNERYEQVSTEWAAFTGSAA